MWRIHINYILLVFPGSTGAISAVETPRAIRDFRDSAHHRSALHVNVPYRKENADSRAAAGIEFFAGDIHDLSVSGRNNRGGVGRDRALGIAKEIKNEAAKENQNSGRKCPVKKKTGDASNDRRDRKFVRIFDHLIGSFEASVKEPR